MAFASRVGKGGRPRDARSSCYPLRMPVGRLSIFGGSALALALLVAWWWPHGETLEPVTTPVVRGRIVAEVTATGRVEPRRSVEVGTYVSGPIQEVDVDFNTPVRRGQRLAKIDPRTFAGQVASARADVALAVVGAIMIATAMVLFSLPGEGFGFVPFIVTGFIAVALAGILFLVARRRFHADDLRRMQAMDCSR